MQKILEKVIENLQARIKIQTQAVAVATQAVEQNVVAVGAILSIGIVTEHTIII